MFLIDNDVLSQLNRPRPDPAITAWFAGLRPSEFGIAGITIFEQFRGIALVRGRNPTLAHTLSLWWEGFLATLAPEQLIAAHVDVLREQAELYAQPALDNFLRPHGSGAAPVKTGGDLVLAATAAARNMPIATLNVADFLEIHAVRALPGLYDPRAAHWHVPYASPSSQPSITPAAHPMGENTFVEALSKVAWQWPYSLAVAQGQSATLVELLRRCAEGTDLRVDLDVAHGLARASDRGALLRYVRKIASSLDQAVRIELATAMLGQLDELNAEPDASPRIQP